MVRFTNIAISVFLILVLAVAAYQAIDPIELANKRRDSLLKMYAARLKLAPKEYLEQLYVLSDRVCYSPASSYVRKGSCNQDDVYRLSPDGKKLTRVSCSLDSTWPVAGDTWVICGPKNE